MPQYGMIVYSPAPADPSALSADYLSALEEYPERAKALKGKVLGGTYFAKQRGFALDQSSEAVAVQGDTARNGTLVGSDLVGSDLVGSDLVVAAFFVVAAPSMDVATEIARLHPATRDGGVEVRPLFVPADQVQDDYAD